MTIYSDPIITRYERKEDLFGFSYYELVVSDTKKFRIYLSHPFMDIDQEDSSSPPRLIYSAPFNEKKSEDQLREEASEKIWILNGEDIYKLPEKLYISDNEGDNPVNERANCYIRNVYIGDIRNPLFKRYKNDKEKILLILEESYKYQFIEIELEEKIS